jgi:hypothetical protein
MISKVIDFLQTRYPALFLILQRGAVDRAVFFGVSVKVWGIITGPVTLMLIASRFSPVLQGYYYTFGSILALQVFIELGLGVVIIQFASHEWSRLRVDEHGKVTGDPESLSKLSSLANVASKWYMVGGFLVALGLGFGGYLFFSRSPAPDANWVAPWLVLCAFTGVNIFFVPFFSLLEGCNQVSNLYIYRFFEGLFSSISIWIAIYAGAKLWTAPISSLVIVICAGVFLGSKYRVFLKSIISSRSNGPAIAWRRDILPLQWRIALSWISGYFAFSLFTPVLFHYHGPLIAGQFGMTWSVVGFIGSISTSWIAPRVPQFGMLIASGDYKKFDDLFRRVTIIVWLITALLAICCWACIYLLNIFDYTFAKRLLPPLPAGILIFSQVLFTISLPFSLYLRAHKKEPLMFLSVLYGISVGFSALILGKYYSVNDVLFGYLVINMISLPIVVFIWRKLKKEWH